MESEKRYKLVIHIPSYNRVEKLIVTLDKLLPQCISYSDICINVQDNHSDTDYKVALQACLRQYSSAKFDLEVNRNAVNIGMGANILKGFERQDAEWLWILSDDDNLASNAVSNIRESMAEVSKDIGFIRFSSQYNSVPMERSLHSFKEFVEHANSYSSFNNYIFISNGIYRLSKLKHELAHGYNNCHTYVPHFMMLSSYMIKGGSVVISPLRIVQYEVPEVGYNYALVLGLGVGAPKHLLLGCDRRTIKNFHALFFPHNDIKVLVDLFVQTKTLQSKHEFIYLAKTYVSYLRVARSLPWRMILTCLIYLRLLPFGFDIFVSLLARLSSTAAKHIDEMRVRYQ